MSIQTLQIDAVTARKEYPAASDVMKAILEQSFGKPFFSQDITERIQNMDDVFAEAGVVKEDFYAAYASYDDYDLAVKEAELIAKAYNQGAAPGRYRYFPWFYTTKYGGAGGFRFGVSHCGLTPARMSAPAFA